jgi:hypothetical protein
MSDDLLRRLGKLAEKRGDRSSCGMRLAPNGSFLYEKATRGAAARGAASRTSRQIRLTLLTR